MGGSNYYLITSLPRLGELGSPPPLGLRELLEHVADRPAAAELVATILLSDDLVKRQALLAGEIEQAEGTILNNEQLRDHQPLPEYLVGGERLTSPAAAADAVWAAYFRHAADVAGRLGSAFLAGWTGYEVALRNALASARAKALGLESAEHRVATELGAAEDELAMAAVVSEWTAAANPLAGQRVLDAARWDWLTQHDGWFTFQDDELAAYAAKLILLHRWQRLTE
jgi:hypothetical protein